MAIRNIHYQLEAKLKGTGGGFFSRPSGRLERKRYEDSGERLKIKVRNLNVPDQSVGIVIVDKKEIARISISDGFGKYDEEFNDSQKLPSMEENQIVEVYVGGEQLLSGKLYQD